jgi:GcrA cell cycle regulator
MSNRSDPIEWTPEVVLPLRQLWDEGHSTAEIGRRLGVSKNAVVGTAHRLDLSRPSARTSLTDRRISSGRRRNGQRTSLLACS